MIRAARLSSPRILVCLPGVFLLIGVLRSSAAAEESAIRAQFHPYDQGSPHVSGIEPGATLTAENVQRAREVLSEEVLNLIASGTFCNNDPGNDRSPPSPFISRSYDPTLSASLSQWEGRPHELSRRRALPLARSERPSRRRKTRLESPVSRFWRRFRVARQSTSGQCLGRG